MPLFYHSVSWYGPLAEVGMEFGTEFTGKKIAVVFDLTVATAQRYERIVRVGNPVLHSHDSTGVYIVGVPEGQDDHWLRAYRAVPGVVAVDPVRPSPGQR